MAWLLGAPPKGKTAQQTTPGVWVAVSFPFWGGGRAQGLAVQVLAVGAVDIHSFTNN